MIPSIPSFHRLRGGNVLLDFELAAVYGLETRRLNEKVKRRRGLFARFQFQLTKAEWKDLRVSGQSRRPPGWGGRRKLPTAFTEHGVILLSALLGGEALEANLNLIETFAAMKAEAPAENAS